MDAANQAAARVNKGEANLAAVVDRVVDSKVAVANKAVAGRRAVGPKGAAAVAPAAAIAEDAVNRASFLARPIHLRYSKKGEFNGCICVIES